MTSKNPDVGTPAIPPRPQLPPQQMAVTGPTEGGTHFPGADLVPQGGHKAGRAKVYKYWVGLTPRAPVEHIDIAGINFPKRNENIVPDPLRTGQKKRVPVIGSIVFLDAVKIRLIVERLPRTVIRFRNDDGEKEEAGTGLNVGDNHRPPSKGSVVRIPTAAEVAQRRHSGKPVREYVEQENDVPAARYLFAQVCADQDRGSRGDIYPETIETAGINWPETLDARAEAILG